MVSEIRTSSQKWSKGGRGKKKQSDMSDKKRCDSNAPKQPTFIKFAAQGDLQAARLAC